MNYLAGTVLVICGGDLRKSFWIFCGIVERTLTDYYAALDLLIEDTSLFEGVASQLFPDLMKYWGDIGASEWIPATILRWFHTLYSLPDSSPSFPVRIWIWDHVIKFGPRVLFEVALSLVRMCRGTLMRLYEPEDAKEFIQEKMINVKLEELYLEMEVTRDELEGKKIDIQNMRFLAILKRFPTPLRTSSSLKRRLILTTHLKADVLVSLFRKYATTTPRWNFPILELRDFHQIMVILQVESRPTSDITVPLQWITDIFHLIDVDGDGAISFFEFISGLFLTSLWSSQLSDHLKLLYEVLACHVEEGGRGGEGEEEGEEGGERKERESEGERRGRAFVEVMYAAARVVYRSPQYKPDSHSLTHSSSSSPSHPSLPHSSSSSLPLSPMFECASGVACFQRFRAFLCKYPFVLLHFCLQTRTPPIQACVLEEEMEKRRE